MEKLLSMTAYTPIKINLALHILGINEKKYHLLDSLVVFRQAGDKITIKKSSEDFIITGKYAKQLSTKNNLILSAKNLLKQYCKNYFDVEITLEKNLPVASGLGGGSGDAAITLYMLNNIWQAGLSGKQLTNISKELGADLPCCIDYLFYKKSSYISGIGEIIDHIEYLPEFYLVIINNNKPVNTSEVFKLLQNKNNHAINRKHHIVNYSELIEFLKTLRNDLYKPAIEYENSIAKVLTNLSEADFFTMSGSGGSCIAIFEKKEDAKETANKIKQKHPDWFIKCC